MGTVLLAFAAVPLACSGRVASNANDGGTGGSSSGTGSSGSGSGSGSSSGVISSSSTGGSSSGGGSGSSGGAVACTGNDCCSQLPPGACVVPPPPSGASSGGSTPHNYAVHKLYLGDTDRMGLTNPDAWRALGYNLDGKITTSASTDVCTLVAGASKSVQIDGSGGIDNSWGANIVPILATLDSTFSQTENNLLQEGWPTQLFYAVGFDDSAGNMTTATGLSGAALFGANYSMANGGMAPTWDLSTHWPLGPESLNCFPSGGTDGCTTSTDPIGAADVKFPAAYQTQGTFVNGAPSLITLQISIGPTPMTLNLHGAVVTFDPQVPGAVTNGTIAGVINTQELIAALKQVAGQISTSLCSGSAFQSIASQIEQTSDIVLSGDAVSNSPGSMCNAISIGLGFDATEVALPTGADIAPPQPPAPDPCASGG
ncbi:MAG TPA: hypothetical protein VMI75_10645 [Polyangiaceae bacterium]|nr:hypothetical protein [Polyangiaceae bacterium]